MSAYADVRTQRDLGRALARDAIPLVVRGARVASSAAATHMIEAGSLAVSGRGFARAYGGSVRASGAVTVLAEGAARIHVADEATAFVGAGFEGTVDVDGAARCVLPVPAKDVADFCRIHRINVERGAIAVWGGRDGRAPYAGDVAWYRAFSGRSARAATRIPLGELALSGSRRSLESRSGVSIGVHATSARIFARIAGPEIVVAGKARRTIRGPARVRVGEEASVRVRGPALVTVWGRSCVEATDDAIVVTLDAARVIARGRAFVRAFDASKVEAHDESVVLASEYSRVLAYDQSRIETEFSAVVEAHDASLVRAFDESTVFADDGVGVAAAGYAVVHASPHADVIAGPCVTVRRQVRAREAGAPRAFTR